MGVWIKDTRSYFEYNKGGHLTEQALQVLKLAENSLLPLMESGIPGNLSHLIVCTTCPDMLSPSLGQMINERHNGVFGNCHTIDIMQGCAGGVSAMILASQLADINRSSVIVVQADAARKAASASQSISNIFGNGSFAGLFCYEDSEKALIHSASKQYKGLSEVVTVKLGHDADKLILDKKNQNKEPRVYLGLAMRKGLALQLYRNAETFYQQFIFGLAPPDIMILHQVNPLIVSHLKKVFGKYPVEFVDFSAITGNCGSASVGIAYDLVKEKMAGKRIFLCSFGTGGVITAGLWQQ